MTTITETWVGQQPAPPQQSLHLRLIRPEDLVLLCEMHHRLSSESIYLRYLQYKVPSLDELAAIKGVGPAKLRLYGQPLLDAVRASADGA